MYKKINIRRMLITRRYAYIAPLFLLTGAAVAATASQLLWTIGLVYISWKKLGIRTTALGRLFGH